VSIGTDLENRPLSTLDKSLITSATSLLALFASPLSGVLADALGRHILILFSASLFTVGALWQALTQGVGGMIFGRGIVGLAVGSASFVVPLYISELAPASFRGRLVTVQALFITGGQVVAYVVGWLFSNTPGGWRWMVGLGMVPAVVQFVMLYGLPESPRWLVKAGKKEAARKVLLKVYGGKGSDEARVHKLVNRVLRSVENEVYEEEEAASQGTASGSRKGGWARIKDSFTLLVNVGGNRRALVIVSRAPTIVLFVES